MNLLSKYIPNNLNFKHFKQTFFLTFAQIFSLGAGFTVTIFLANKLGVKDFGKYTFASSVMTFCGLFFEFGFIASGSRLLAKAENQIKEKQLLGAILIISMLIAFIYISFIWGTSFVVDKIFKDKIGYILRVVSIISFAYLSPFFMELILKGCNKIEHLAFYNLLWKIILLGMILIIDYFFVLTSLNAILIFAGTCIVSMSFVLYRLKPDFKNITTNVSLIFNELKAYGINVYIGRVVDTATFSMDTMFISFFHMASDVGLYGLAYTVVRPVSIFSRSLSMVKFKHFANGDNIDNKTYVLNMVGTAVASLSAMILGFVVIKYYLDIKYRECLILMVILNFAVLFQSSYQLYNSWLASNGYASILKKKSFVTAAVNLVLNIVLIPAFSSLGAAIASALSMLSSLLLYVYFYKHALSSIKKLKYESVKLNEKKLTVEK